MAGAYFAFVLAAVLASAAVAGTGPALLATALSSAWVGYFILPPSGSWALDLLGWLRLALFGLAAVAMSVLVGRRRRMPEPQRTLEDGP
jgi:membrane protein implicated in regulation of membrane protease activity